MNWQVQKPILVMAVLAVTVGFTAIRSFANSATATTPSTAPATTEAVCPADEGRQLPAGHPALGAAAATAAPAVAPAATVGSIEITVTQGTKGGPAVGALPATVQLYQDGAPTKKYDVTLDANGHAVIPNVPVSGTIEPVVIIDHAGVTQQAGGTMDASNPKAQVVMSLYETASAAPAWTIGMRHVIVHSTAEGLQVTEMIAVNNPTDRIWTGNTQDTMEHVTFALPLPKGVTNVELGGGFQEPYAKIVGTALASTLPLFPGPTQFQIDYTIPVTNGAAQWTIAAPAAVEQLIVFAPADKSTVTVDGAKDSGTVDMGQGPMHMFRGAGIKAGQAVTLSFTGLTAIAATASDTVAPAAASVNWAKKIGGIGAIAVVVVGSAILLIRRPKGAQKA